MILRLVSVFPPRFPLFFRGSFSLLLMQGSVHDALRIELILVDSKPKKKKAAKDDDDNVRFKEESD